jgi:tripartite-type tricarboxylate transporter receptor subunit TctC
MMSMRGRIRRSAVAVLLATAVAATTASADPVADFYKDKKVQLMIGFGAGEAYDAYARTLAHFMPKYLPGHPSFIPQNMPGAGSLNAANAIYNTAPRDGTAFGTVHRFVPLMPLLGVEGPKFDPLKFTYIGSMNREIGVCVVMKSAGFSSLDEMKTREFVVGTTGAGAELTTFNATVSHMLGIKLKVVTGYRTSLEINLAMERGEVQGRCGVSYGSLKNTRPEWLSDKKIDILLQLGLSKDPELPDVPLLGDLVSDSTDKAALHLMLAPSEIGRPFFGPPGVPPERLKALRAAFDAALKDPDLVAEAEKQRLDISPVSGEEMTALIARAYAAPEPVVERARSLVAMGTPNK